MKKDYSSLAVAFMRRPPTERERIADVLGIGDDLPERHPEASFVILRRVRDGGLHDALRAELNAQEPRCVGHYVGTGYSYNGLAKNCHHAECKALASAADNAQEAGQ